MSALAEYNIVIRPKPGKINSDEAVDLGLDALDAVDVEVSLNAVVERIKENLGLLAHDLVFEVEV